ncbi:iron chelate uptake ABC transporter family permease subunit [Devosia sp. MC1541]|uniref:iron chelate uptake ABC transporter family permease subunit n=1 Tax=Devosia sp. MC1541 TaxID=2725264 RepID=UPI00145F48B8|nr:iron chelate uptake ABC transporter family permease subunit [Devosia sp. MC1541]
MASLSMTSQKLAQGEAKRPGVVDSNRSRLLGLIVCFCILIFAVMLSLAIGARYIPVVTVVDALFAYNDSDDHAIIAGLRAPRTIMGVLVGIALGLSGALIQALTRNPLADPGILGINAGAAFFVVIGIGFFGISGIGGYVWFALAGAISATVIVYVIGSAGRGGATPLRLTLSGVALGAVLGGVTSGISLLDPSTFDRMRQWSAGSLVTTGYEALSTVWPFFLVGFGLALFVARPLNAVALGNDLAAALGANLWRTRTLVVIATTLLAGASTAAVGPIGFVGLMVPHVARWYVGPDQRWIFSYTAVLAPILLLVSDIVGRVVLAPGELQVGIVLAFMGAPVVIFLARRGKVSGL